MTLHDVLARLDGVKRKQNYCTARCPAHEDKHASLSVTEREGRILMRCHAGCSFDEIASALGLKKTDFFTEQTKDEPQKKRKGLGKIIEVYAYTDPHGVTEFEVCRTEDKEFPQRHYVDNKPVWGLNGQVRYPYRLPKVLDAVRAGQPVYIVEGEKDVHALEGVGAAATCNSGGAGKWTSDHARWLDGARHVVIVRDKDEAGVAHGNAVALTLKEIGVPYEIVEALSGKDAADHIAAGHGLTDFKPVREEAKAAGPFKFFSLRELLSLPPKAMMVEGLLGKQDRAMIFGPSWHGKTTVLFDMLVSCMVGGAFAGHFSCERPLSVLYCTNEGKFGISPRMHACMVRHRVEPAEVEGRFQTVFDIPQLFAKDDPRHVLAFIEQVERMGLHFDIVVFDTMSKATLGSKEVDNSEAAMVCDALARMNERLDCSTILVHHSGHDKDYPRGASAYIGDMDLILRCQLDDPDGTDGKLHLYKGKDIPRFDDLRYRITEGEGAAVVEWPETASDEQHTLTAIALLMTNREDKEWWTATEIKTALQKEGVGAAAIDKALQREKNSLYPVIQRKQEGSRIYYRRAAR